jgi:hypothetical protein
VSIQDAIAAIATLPANVLTGALHKLTNALKTHRQRKRFSAYGIKAGQWVGLAAL